MFYDWMPFLMPTLPTLDCNVQGFTNNSAINLFFVIVKDVQGVHAPHKKRLSGKIWSFSHRISDGQDCPEWRENEADERPACFIWHGILW
jgi:hypothetical protein